MIPYNPDWGNYRTRKFKQIFPDTDAFVAEVMASDLSVIEEKDLRTIYALLYARYGNSSIASDDENQFKYGIYSIIFMYGPTWAKRLEVQKSLRELDINELQTGGKAIYNTALNPGSQPSTAALTELTYINQQNTTNYKKSKAEAYSILLSLLETDITKQFIDKFNKLFVCIVQPDYPLYYATTPEEQEIIDN